MSYRSYLVYMENINKHPWVLASSMREVDDWYASYVGNLRESDFDEPVDFVFTNGTAARMRRGEIILHVCLHGTYHRGNAGIVLHKNGIAPNDDRMTDFLETAAVTYRKRHNGRQQACCAGSKVNGRPARHS